MTRSVNLHFHMGADEAGPKPAATGSCSSRPPAVRAVTGTAQEVIDRIAEYMEVGADG